MKKTLEQISARAQRRQLSSAMQKCVVCRETVSLIQQAEGSALCDRCHRAKAETAQPVPASPAGADDMKIYREIAAGVQAPEPVACVSYENRAGHECRKAVLFSNGLELPDGAPLYARPIRPVSGASSALVEKLRHGVQMARLRGPGFTPHLTCDDVAGIADVLDADVHVWTQQRHDDYAAGFAEATKRSQQVAVSGGKLVEQLDMLFTNVTPPPWFSAPDGRGVGLLGGRWTTQGAFANVLRESVEVHGGSMHSNAAFIASLVTAWPAIRGMLAGVQPLTTSPVADQEPPSVHDNAELIADLEGLANEIQLDYMTDAIDSAIQALRWKPEFDAMAPKQEALLMEFCAEISKGVGIDPVRLLEMAEALYLAERDIAPGSQK